MVKSMVLSSGFVAKVIESGSEEDIAMLRDAEESIASGYLFLEHVDKHPDRAGDFVDAGRDPQVEGITADMDKLARGNGLLMDSYNKVKTLAVRHADAWEEQDDASLISLLGDISAACSLLGDSDGMAHYSLELIEQLRKGVDSGMDECLDRFGGAVLDLCACLKDAPDAECDSNGLLREGIKMQELLCASRPTANSLAVLAKLRERLADLIMSGDRDEEAMDEAAHLHDAAAMAYLESAGKQMHKNLFALHMHYAASSFYDSAVIKATCNDADAAIDSTQKFIDAHRMATDLDISFASASLNALSEGLLVLIGPFGLQDRDKLVADFLECRGAALDLYRPNPVDELFSGFDLDSMPHDVRVRLEEEAYDMLHELIGCRTTERLSEEQIDEMDAISDGDAKVVLSWLQENAPNYRMSPEYSEVCKACSGSDDSVAQADYCMRKWIQVNIPDLLEVIEDSVAKVNRSLPRMRANIMITGGSSE